MLQVFVNKVLFTKSHPVHFCITYGGREAPAAELGNCSRDRLICKATDIYFSVIYGNNVLTPCLDNFW